jgi:hypothetical protein
MITLTKNQFGQRWDTLPDILREALVSETNSDFIWSTCEAQNIPDEKIYSVAADIAAVLMGFLRVDDAPEAFKTDAGLDAKAASALQTAFAPKIFAPLKQAIDAAYKPVGEPEIKTSIVPNANATKVFDVATPKATPSATPSTMPAVPIAPKIDLSAKGWSVMRPAEMPKPAPMPPAPKVQPSVQPILSIPRPQNIPQMPKTPVVAPAPTPTLTPTPRPTPAPVATAAPEPAPMMMTGTNFSSAPQKNSDFHLSKSGGGAQVEFGQAKPQAKVMPALIEFSKPATTPSASPVSPTPVPPAAPKGAIHYTEFAPQPLKTMPMAQSGTRNVSEITSNTIPLVLKPPMPIPAKVPVPVPQAPKPASTPIASIPPTPPQPPKPPQVKVITKDFL